MNQPTPASGTWPAIDERTLRQIDDEALKRSGSDAALWFHFRALFEGEFRARQRSREAWVGWRKSKCLPQYTAVEASVIEGWRKYLKNTLGIPKQHQTDVNAVNRALILVGCRRAKNKEQVAEKLKDRAQSIEALAASGDVEFFASLGRRLGNLRGSSLKSFHYVDRMLTHWLTDFLWLMPERTAADWLAHRYRLKNDLPQMDTAQQSDRLLRHFKETKRDYQLKSHRPSLISHIESNGNLVFTPKGRSIFRSLIPSK